jgi:RNA polymerase sigma-70 factor (ECF subfamily)
MIARTTCVDWLRKERIKPASLEKIAEDGLEPEGEFLGSMFKQTSTEVEELREKILHVVNALPRIYQQIILLRHLRKMTYREMSDFLGLPVATIESRLYRARIMLKDKLMDLYC